MRSCAATANRSTGPTCTSNVRSEEHTSELQSQFHLVCRLLLEKKNSPNPDNIYGNPAKLSPNREKISRNPDRISGNRENDPANPDNNSPNPEKISRSPAKFSPQP